MFSPPLRALTLESAWRAATNPGPSGSPGRIFLVCASLFLLACGRSEPPPRFAPPNPERTEELEPAEEPADGDALSDPGMATPAPTAPGTPTSAPGAPPAAQPDPPPAPQIDTELCRSACENALTVTLGELPETAIASMRDELTRALRDDCPARCIAKASLESARCIASAKTALALASCP